MKKLEESLEVFEKALEKFERAAETVSRRRRSCAVKIPVLSTKKSKI